MNAVEIEEAISALAAEPFDPDEFPYAFLEAFGNKATTIKRLRSGSSNRSDVDGVLQTSNIHIKTCAPGEVADTLTALRNSPATARAKAKFILATDGVDFQAEDLASDIPPVVCDYNDFPEHFGFFLPLAGISTVRQVRESAFDIKATGRLNRLYIELLRNNPDWGTADRRPELNHFMARLIFSFFAEDTDIFNGEGLFTQTIEQMSESDGSNTGWVISELFRAMNTRPKDRPTGNFRPWANIFPYVNGGLFSGSVEVPRFSRMARTYLLNVGKLDWTKINPDIFGSMIQAVADDDERGALGMHYTSVPNILKVLNPLFLDDLREKLEDAEGNPRKLLNLRNRMARIRVFDPACGSGNFLVIAYKEMRAIEANINQRRNEKERNSDIPLTNFRGIEIRDFPAEIARLALIIAEYQCDVLYRGQKEALAEFLPLDAMNWITCGNALRLDWLSLMDVKGTGVKHHADDLFHTPLDQAQIDFENEGGETYICGNPPYRGSQWQSEEQKSDLGSIFDGRVKNWKSLDYVTGWFMKAADYGRKAGSIAAFVTTNSICQGRQVGAFWPIILATGHEITFAHTSFKWANLATQKAVVTVVIVGISINPGRTRRLFTTTNNGEAVLTYTENINPYLVPASNVIVEPKSKPISRVSLMNFGSMPNDGGNLLVNSEEARRVVAQNPDIRQYIRPIFGTQEFINGIERRCIWVEDPEYHQAREDEWLQSRFQAVSEKRLESSRSTTKKLSEYPHRFGEIRQKGNEVVTIISKTSSETREYIPVNILSKGSIVSEAFALFDAPLWNIALLVSALHLVWIATVCGKLKTDFRYSNTLGWNTFPVPQLTDKNRADLTRCAEDILLTRENHFPATIANLYDPQKMPDDLRAAHDRNDEVLERIYIGRRFRNDTERLEKLFELYTRMTAAKTLTGSKFRIGA
ncbi:class I SAM-dependent DNA methyltransferase [Thalassobaculum salexigens]|uniref:class I SAM-dependent DNA methyltransferase n=1 Tax=Thalassobaculum salexigens TaxID=455360 RepID=UPI0003F569ED|nr:DNA methyltransferase [Thalassobaculum salexigens]